MFISLLTQSVAVPENSYMSTSGFLICGDKVQAASVMLPRSSNMTFPTNIFNCFVLRKIKSEKKVIAELQKLKDSGICEENSFAFMFACCGRGQNFYK